MRFLILNEVLGQDLIEILILEQSHWDSQWEKHFFPVRDEGGLSENVKREGRDPDEEDLHEDAVGNEDIHKSRTIQQSLFMDDKWE